MYAIANTFGLACSATAHANCTAATLSSSIEQALTRGLRIVPVGSASNILFIDQAIDALILQSAEKQICYQADPTDRNAVLVEVGAGVIWHQLVLDSLAQGYSGLENLSLIPGTVGAAPIQNIGAYGVEVGELITRVHAIDLFSGQKRQFSADDCKFAYRDSIFKQHYKDRLLITSVQFRLFRRAPVKASYESLAHYLQDKNPETLTARDISNAVIAVRRAKLPDPDKLGNAGSFFKNPIIAPDQFESLVERCPTLPHYPQANGNMKIAAGWLIEMAGLKGITRGHVGTHEKQALVLVNRGGATGMEVLQLAREIKSTVIDRFGIVLEHEVRLIDGTGQEVCL